MSIAKGDLDDLKYAKTLLENPSLAARISNLLGTPIEKGLEHLPPKWKGVVQKATKKSLDKALNFAVQTMDDRTRPASDKTHKILVFATGAGGGSFGLLPSFSLSSVGLEKERTCCGSGGDEN